MKIAKSIRVRLTLLLVVAVMVCSCRTVDRGVQARVLPPEQQVVDENGSIPIGLEAVYREAGITPGCIACNSQNRYGKDLSNYSKVSAELLLTKIQPFLQDLATDGRMELLKKELTEHLMNAMIRAVLIEGNNNNLGAFVLKNRFWTDASGNKHPLVVFRTAFTPDPKAENSCYRSLLKNASIAHVVNLYDGSIDVDDLVKAEKEVATESGASYIRTADLDYGEWRNSIRKFDPNDPALDQIMKDIARLIKEQILMPTGKPPRGNILIHCGGGMHRTGMIVGILQKAINGLSIDEIKKTYGYHVGYKDQTNPGGFEQENLDFIEHFKSEYLY